MPIYEYRCPNCSSFEVLLRMGTALDTMSCPSCQRTSRRRISAPHLSGTGSAAFRLMDSADRSAHEPAVVESPRPGARVGRAQTVQSNPLHRTLPRP